ncbi:ISWI chromatin-remodeling complex ATPase ISW2-like isoform X2 [Bidens hawaiensis]|uniref:ISWI chromatin-remodeling complex ATPase ISW2-like isoform X2 n=1 Tax=Bidens hawaiensis TaxID=980011 RepID=UPI00404B459F
MSTKKRKRKYSNWSTQFEDSGDPRSLRQACYRSSRLATNKLKAVAQEYPSPSLCSGQETIQQSGTKDKIESGVCSVSDSTYATGSSELADEVSTETLNNILPYVNKLRDHRVKGQNAVIFDGQERVVKVVSFVSSLVDNTKKPILVISASSSALLLWQMEFAKWSKSVNVVIYKGNKDTRAAIIGSGFQVLLSSPDAIVEDMEMFDHIKWELLVIDECQCPVISTHLNKFQMLMADMKLLTVSGEPVSYRNILSLVDCKNEKTEMKDDNISILKERLSPFIAFECKFNMKESSAVKVVEIPASALVPGRSLAGSGVLFSAPHLRSNPSLFASLHNRLNSGEPSLVPKPHS